MSGQTMTICLAFTLMVYLLPIDEGYRNQAAPDQFIAHFARHNTKMNDLGFVNQFRGIKVQQDKSRGLLKISQAGYVDEMLQRLNMTDCHGRHIPLDPGIKFSRTDEPKCKAQETALYHEIIGMIGWKATWTSPGLAYTHSYLFRFLVSPAVAHLQAAKDVLRYIKMTWDKGPIYS